MADLLKKFVKLPEGERRGLRFIRPPRRVDEKLEMDEFHRKICFVDLDEVKRCWRGA